MNRGKQQQASGDLSGQRVLITGANSGIGLETARAMAARGAEVILACRNAKTSVAIGERSPEQVMLEIERQCPGAKLHYLEIDLADQSSLIKAAANFHKRFESLDVLINNAGVMWVPQSATKDGFEFHFGVNYLGHYTLTGLLLPALRQTTNSRVVSLSSLAHLPGRIDFDDPFFKLRRYTPAKAYSQSKLANLLFSRELGRRLQQAQLHVLSVAAHPGVASTNLMRSAFSNSPFLKRRFELGMRRFGQAGVDGAQSTLFAATNANMRNGDYIGPSGLFELWGTPGPAFSSTAARNWESARRLWDLSEQLTGVTYNFGAH